ncbi:MAG: hypothetical protein ACLSHM_06800 [Vescimonas sp.]
MAYDGRVLRQATLRFDEDKQRRQEQQRQRQQSGSISSVRSWRASSGRSGVPWARSSPPPCGGVRTLCPPSG